jgi:protein-disulfide isomerase
MHNLIYENQNAWIASSNPLDNFTNYAQSLGLNLDQFRSDVQNNKYKDKIDTDLADGNALNVNATPTLYINGTQTSANSFADLKNAIDAALAK